MGKKKMSLDIQTMNPTQVVLKLASQNQEELQKVSIQISSGNKNEDFKGFAADATTESFLSFKATLGDIDTHVRSNNTAISRAKVTDTAITNLQSIANDLSTLITERRNGASGSNLPIDVEVQGMLDKIAGELNVKFDGRYLFAGSKTNTAPIANIQTSNLDENGDPTDNYYQGDNDVPTVRSSDSETTTYGVLGNDSAFQSLIAAANLLKEGHDTNDDAFLSKAMDLVGTAVQQLATARANALTSIDRMTKSNSTHSDFKLLIQGNLDKVSQTDIVQATSKMSELQAIVQAGYLAFSRMSSLQLTNYLK